MSYSDRWWCSSHKGFLGMLLNKALEQLVEVLERCVTAFMGVIV